MHTQSESSDEIHISLQEVSNQIFSYYLKLRSDELPSFATAIPQQFNKIQKQIISLVELRKNMEKSLQLDQLQSQHFNTISNLVEKNVFLQQSVTQMGRHIKQVEDKYMNQYIQSLKTIQQESNKQSQIIQKAQNILFELSDFKRGFNLDSISNGQFDEADKETLQLKQWQHEEYFKQLMESQQKRWDLARFIYSTKLKEIILRDQLLQQRECVHLDLERSNSDLIDTLLRQKERDKNLRKKDNQKFGEIIKLRDQIELQNQNLSHSQKTLLPILQNQLLKIKAHLKQQEQKHQIQIQKLNKKNQELQRQLNKAKSQSKSIQSKFSQKQKHLKDTIQSLKNTLQQIEEKKKLTETTLKISKSKQTQKDKQFDNLRLKIKELQQINDQLSNKNDQLQSQYNQLILKSSQLNHIKADLSQKLQKNTKKVQQFENKLEQAKKILNEKNDELKNLQFFLNTLKSEKINFEQQISTLQRQLSASKQYNAQYQQKINLMQAELTENFIIHNEQRNNMLYQLQEKSKKINSLNIELHQLKQIKPSATNHIESQDTFSFSVYEHIKQEIIDEMRRSQKIKFTLIDEFVDKVNNYIT